MNVPCTTGAFFTPPWSEEASHVPTRCAFAAIMVMGEGWQIRSTAGNILIGYKSTGLGEGRRA